MAESRKLRIAALRMLRARCAAALGAILLTLTLLASCTSQEPSETPAASPTSKADVPQAAAGTLFVTNEMSDDLSVIDTASQRVINTIALGKRPRGIKISPDGSTLYVALSGSPMAPPGTDESTLPPPDRKADGIGVVDIREGRLQRVIPAGTDPEQLAVSLDGRWLFVANEDAGQTSVIDVTDGRLVASIAVGGEPEGVDLRPDGKVVYVTSEADNQIAVIDAVAPKLITTFSAGPRPRSTGFLPDSSRAYISAENGSSVIVADAMNHKVIRTIQLAGEMVRPMGVVSSVDGKQVFVSTGRGKSIVVIDTATNEATGAIEVGERPWGIATSPDGRTVFTANGPSNDVSFVDIASGTVIAKVKAGDRPWGVAFVPR
jgi:YVTN family beta-propeller protein